MPIRSRIRLAVAALFALTASAFAQSPQEPVEIAAGHLKLALTPGAGLTLTVHGVPFLTESSLYIVTPGWTRTYLNQDQLKATIRRSEENGARVATAEYETPEAYARYRYEVSPDDTFRVTVRYGTKDGQEARAQYQTYLNANALSGAGFEAQTIAGPRAGTIPVVPGEGSQEARKFTPDLKRITLRSRLGDVSISVESDAPETSALTFFEARTDTQAWARTRPILWLGIGVPAKPVAKGGTRITTTYRFGPPRVRGTVASAPGTAKVIPLSAAYRPGAVELPLIPRPKDVQYLSGPFARQGGGIEIIIPDNPAPEEKAAAREIVTEFRTFWGQWARISRESSRRREYWIKPLSILLGRSSAFRPEVLVKSALNVPDRAEGYALRASHDTPVSVNGSAPNVLILGRDARGVYNGAQTLKQLIRRDARGVYVKPIAIRDWPSLGFRGVHWFGGPNSLPFHRRMIERVVGPLKMNAMVYEVEYTQWESQKAIWHPERSTPKDQVAKTVALARAHFLEPIPMITSLGHVDWLFRNGQNRDLVMDPEKPYAYNPDVPRTYDVMTGLFQEAIDLFHPKYFHIGHDEVTLTGRFPPPGYPKTATQLFVEDTERLHKWLSDRGLKTIMWGDQMLHESEGITSSWCETPEDAKARREALPKDIIVADWHYRNADPTYPSVALYQKLGYPVIGTGWSEPNALRSFVRSLVREKSMGYLQSTWAGYAMSEDLVTGQEFPQFVGYLLAAEYAWNGGEPGPSDLGYSPDLAFLHFWNRAPSAGRKLPGFTVNLYDPSNWTPPASPRPPSGSAHVLLDGLAFDARRAVLLSGSLNPEGIWPRAISLRLGRKASALHILWSALYAVPVDTRAATVRVLYADGTEMEAPIRYGREIFALTDDRFSRDAPIAYRAKSKEGENAAVRRWTWTNPHPEKDIQCVEIASAGTEAAPLLVGLTGVQGVVGL